MVRPGLTTFAITRRPSKSIAVKFSNAKSLWFYQSCASHGCNIEGGAYFAGWPSYMIDAPATANRVMAVDRLEVSGRRRVVLTA